MISSYVGGIVALLLLTSFIKILLTLSILRVGLGLEGFALGTASVALALAFSLLTFEPNLGPNAALKALELEAGNSEQLEQRFRPFLERYTDKDLLQRISAVIEKSGRSSLNTAKPEKQTSANVSAQDRDEESSNKLQSPKQTAWGVLVACFMISEVRSAFSLGLILLLPFFIIDLLVLNLFGLFSINTVSQRLVAVPLKLMLFVALDGWTRVSEALLRL
jgi:flagellar biosynthesis protein FliP